MASTKRHAKILIWLLAALALAPALAFVAYDVVLFRSHSDDIALILAEADPQDRDPPPRIRAYIAATHRDGAPLSSVVARALQARFLPSRSMFVWHLRGMVWERLVALDLSADEMTGLYATLANNGQGAGLNALSLRLFSKPLDALSEREAATVIAYRRAPGLSARRPDLLAARRDALLATVQGEP